MSDHFCKTCGEFSWNLERHECPPVFYVWPDDEGYSEEDAREIQARDAETAATEWAHIDDVESADYRIVSGNTATVKVKDLGGTVKRFEVNGEAVPQYYAEAL